MLAVFVCLQFAACRVTIQFTCSQFSFLATLQLKSSTNLQCFSFVLSSAIVIEALQLFSGSCEVSETFVLQLWLQFCSFAAAVLQLCGLQGLQACVSAVFQFCNFV